MKFTGTAATTYVYDAMGLLVAEYGTPSAADSGTKYISIDHLGSTRLVTDTAQNQEICYDYLPFGELIATGTDGRSGCYGSTATPLTQKFTGKERDTETSLDFFQARYHGSAQGRFLSPDPLGIFVADPTNPQSWNQYSYVLNSPLINIDPSGMSCLDADGNIVDDKDPDAIGDNGDGQGCSSVGVAAGDPNAFETLNPTDYANETVAAQQGSWFDYLWATTFNNIPIYVPNDVPLSPNAQIFARQLSKQIDQYPTACGGGAYFYAGREISAGPVHGFTGAITELDSRAGLSQGALFEAGGGEGTVGGGGYAATTNSNGQPSGSALAYGGVGVSSPVASASGGAVGFGSGGGISGAGLYGEGFLFGRGAGGGAYVNITNIGKCHQMSLPLIALVLLGPLSSASPNGQGPLFSWFLILVGGSVVFTVWCHYLKRRREVEIPLLNLLGISGISLVLIVAGIWSLFR